MPVVGSLDPVEVLPPLQEEAEETPEQLAETLVAELSALAIHREAGEWVEVAGVPDRRSPPPPEGRRGEAEAPVEGALAYSLM